MTESKLEAEATVALDRDDESGTRLVVPDAVRLHHTELAKYLKPGASGEYFYNIGAVQAQAEKAYPMGFDAGSKSRDGEVAGILSAYDILQDDWQRQEKQLEQLQEQMDVIIAHREVLVKRTEKERDDALSELVELKVIQDWANDPEDGMLARARQRDAAMDRDEHLLEILKDTRSAWEEVCRAREAERDDALEQVRALMEAEEESGGKGQRYR